MVAPAEQAAVPLDESTGGPLPSFGDRFHPIKKLAVGGMAEVFLARATAGATG